MAITPGYSGLLQNVYPQLNQWSVAKGRRPSQQMVRGLLGADAFKAKQIAMAEADRQSRLQIEQQRTNILQDQANAAKTAGIVGGVGQIAQLPLAYGAAKSLGWVGGAPNPSSTAQGLVGAVGTTGGAQLGNSAVPGIGQATLGKVGPTSPNVGGVGGEGLWSAAAPYAAPAGAGLLGGQVLGSTLDKVLPGGGKFGKFVGGAAGGAVAGAAAGSIVPGPGTLVGGAIGGIIGGISSLF